jgi:hypothetical protein
MLKSERALLPAKENGPDGEGICAGGDRVLLRANRIGGARRTRDRHRRRIVRPRGLKAIGAAFDSAWSEISNNFGDDTVDVEKVHLRCASA